VPSAQSPSSLQHSATASKPHLPVALSQVSVVQGSWSSQSAFALQQPAIATAEHTDAVHVVVVQMEPPTQSAVLAQHADVGSERQAWSFGSHWSAVQPSPSPQSASTVQQPFTVA